MNESNTFKDNYIFLTKREKSIFITGNLGTLTFNMSRGLYKDEQNFIAIISHYLDEANIENSILRMEKINIAHPCHCIKINQNEAT